MAVIGVSLFSETNKKPYSIHEKAFFMDNATVEFIRPGLVFSVNSASIASDGTIAVTYTITDSAGNPLDAAGVATPGVISPSFIAAVLPANSRDYFTYTTRATSGSMIASIQQPGKDSGGTTTQIGNGQYTYTFATKAPAGFDTTATHTIGIYGSRDLSAFNLNTAYASTTYNFVPNGSSVIHVDDVVRTASCNTCHDQLSFHGGSRRGLDMCVLCHNSQLINPDTGLTLDAKVFFHKLHMGNNLPSVIAGGTYSPGGDNNYGNVAYPADPGDPRRCETCHSQTSGAVNATAYLINPTRLTCGSCHDDVNFVTGQNHAGGPQASDQYCSVCHIPQGQRDFDASIKGAHVAPTASSLLSGLAVAITGVKNGAAGTAPVVSFTVKDNSGNGLPLSALSSLSFTMAGPTTDYGTTSFGADVTSPGYVTESASSTSSCDNAGNCMYTFTHVVPAGSTGTYAIGVEARRSETVLAGTPKQMSIQYGAPNKVFYFSVDGSPVSNRRTVVQVSSCNQCHVSLQEHGSLRNDTEYCVFCHNNSNTDIAQRPNATDPTERNKPPQGINLNLLVHRIHYGVNMQQFGRTYVVIGRNGSVNDFSGTLFPPFDPGGHAEDTRNCALCHVNASESNLPLGLHTVMDPQGPINPIQPISSACSGCHVDLPAASHMLSNTTSLGEACTVCHSSGSAFAVDQVHAQY
ncbi:MAG TPA: OmcA/MtrC family decaheme c-type cytochrome [Bryobacteraceae bacterium]|nr:OmcA/MtrC family decaheme c-type cytochrome [Bryobacteraceae bacterium]